MAGRTVPRGKRNDEPFLPIYCKPLGYPYDWPPATRRNMRRSAKVNILTDILNEAIHDLGGEIIVDQFQYSETNRLARVWATSKAISERIEAFIIIPNWIRDPKKQPDIQRRLPLPCGKQRTYGLSGDAT